MSSSRRQQAFAITSPARGTLPYARPNSAASYCGGSPIARCQHPVNDTGRGLRPDLARMGLATLETLGTRLQEQILGAAVDDLGDGPLVIVPPAALHPVPWGLLPALADRAVTVAPSALAWLHARGIEPPSDRTVTVVVGPGLKGAEAEAVALADRYADAEILTAGMATAEKVLVSLEGRWLAHIAAHGTFRPDNPLFSSLLMEDGPLTVHDLQRLGRAPYRLVLSCCDSGVTASAGADELLGLIAALGQLGTAGVLAPVVPVNDAATVQLSLALHERLATGATASQALRDARLSTWRRPVLIRDSTSLRGLRRRMIADYSLGPRLAACGAASSAGLRAVPRRSGRPGRAGTPG